MITDRDVSERVSLSRWVPFPFSDRPAETPGRDVERAPKSLPVQVTGREVLAIAELRLEFVRRPLARADALFGEGLE